MSNIMAAKNCADKLAANEGGAVWHAHLLYSSCSEGKIQSIVWASLQTISNGGIGIGDVLSIFSEVEKHLAAAFMLVCVAN